ncbi:hypothetical protein L6J37_00115 [Photobacterium sp. WH77]|uniref:hypothetical protein n=1 Tax=unclassified Photobacterium TaxID=2628852 RepID=UPI001C482F28|nr:MULTISPECIES: hypothetical protein [unclassified Photobacterium]MBV7261303.1 hypothetical protein [Photobacterium sp. WH24]MCG2835267.1 hypothetical protein [Photobacterium sp. WH77]MCG2842880.1 hypothetical protein [Photobacterium sp. WH80]MDO6583008.1 hypothetical protein [Photobacterium sp. 2_MG-2023]UIP27631.1 hypothetical protein LN341_13590 [Photobacterium sp. TLY01]
MQANQLKKGMWVEYPQGIAEVIEIDPDHDTALIENLKDHKRIHIPCSELTDEPQLHSGCGDYY